MFFFFFFFFFFIFHFFFILPFFFIFDVFHFVCFSNCFFSFVFLLFFLFHVFFHIIFLFLFFQSSEQTPKTGKNRREFLIVIMTIFLCENSMFVSRFRNGPKWSGPAFISLFSNFPFCFYYLGKCFLFFFFLVLSKCVSMLASVSEFNFRSRCSMEMWCRLVAC